MSTYCRMFRSMWHHRRPAVVVLTPQVREYCSDTLWTWREVDFELGGRDGVLLSLRPAKPTALHHVHNYRHSTRYGTCAPMWVGFCSEDTPNFVDLCLQAGQTPFRKILYKLNPVLHPVLSAVYTSSHSYSHRPRAHHRLTPDRLSHLADGNFIRCINSYVHHYYFTTPCLHNMCITFTFWLSLTTLQLRSVSSLNKPMLCYEKLTGSQKIQN